MGIELVCKKCSSTKYKTEMSGQHLKASCADCGAYIKFLPQPIDWDTIDISKEIIHQGKHKGLTYLQVATNDPAYIRWMAENMKGKPAELANHTIEQEGL